MDHVVQVFQIYIKIKMYHYNFLFQILNGEVLSYNLNTNKWINHVLTGTIPVGGLSNVLITNPVQDNQTLLFNASADEWENAFVPNPI